MLRRGFCAILVLVSSTLLTGSASQDPRLPDDLREAIARFYASIDSADVEARIDLLADDVILMPNHWGVMRGKDLVSDSFRRSSKAVFKLKDREVVHFEISGDLAYVVNSYFYTYHAHGAPERWHKTKNVHIWRRNGVGRWLLAVDIWNSDVTIDDFLKE